MTNLLKLLTKILNRKDMPKKPEIGSKSLDLRATINLLYGVDSSTKVDIQYNAGSVPYRVQGASPIAVATFIEDKFSLRGLRGYYNTATHRTMQGDTEVKHQISVNQGQIEGKIGDVELMGEPFRTATIDFSVPFRNNTDRP